MQSEPVPYVGVLDAPLADRTIITVKGNVEENGERFAINLLCGAIDDNGTDIAFHLNPRFNERCIVRNTYHKGRWGAEETASPSNGYFPFEKGKQFRVDILVGHTMLFVRINGNHYCTYSERIPLSKINWMNITGAIKVYKVSFSFAPEYKMRIMKIPSEHTPYVGVLGAPLVNRTIITIEGQVQINCERFAIDLLCGTANYERADIAFHLNPRISAECIVRNTRYKDSWGQEETTSHGCFPFEKGKQFRVDIMVGNKLFFVRINGNHYCIYFERIPLSKINWMEVSGAVKVYSVTFNSASEYEMGMITEIPSEVMPYVGVLDAPLAIQTIISVEGHVEEYCERFAINLLCGKITDERADIAFHLNPRISQRYIVRNSRLNSQWGDEETTSHSPFPFERGEQFRMVVLIRDGLLFVQINGKHYCSYSERINLKSITWINVTGDVKIKAVALNNDCASEYNEMGILEIVSSELAPYVGVLDSPLTVRTNISVNGRVEECCERFAINLLCGKVCDERADIAFHLNPRIGDRCVVRNARLGGFWGDEETVGSSHQGCFPFKREKYFQVDILVGENIFVVRINGYHYCTFSQRIPLSKITWLNVTGGVKILKVAFIKISAGEYNEMGIVEILTEESPYVGALDVPLTIRTLISVKGQVDEYCERFAINLLCGTSDDKEPDIAFHFNPRISERYVVRNTRIKGHWGDEETTTYRSFPFERGKQYRVDILVGDGLFFIQINGKHYCSYSERIPLNKITWMNVTGSVKIDNVSFSSAPEYPILDISANYPEVPILNSLEDNVPTQKWDPMILANLPRGLASGNQLVIRARIHLLPHSFFVNIQEAVRMWPRPTVMFHFNPRFSSENTKQVIVFNSRDNATWGAEERSWSSRLRSGAFVELVFCRGPQRYSCWARRWFPSHQEIGDHENMQFRMLGSMPARTTDMQVGALHVQGDLTVHQIFTCPISPQLAETSFDEE